MINFVCSSLSFSMYGFSIYFNAAPSFNPKKEIIYGKFHFIYDQFQKFKEDKIFKETTNYILGIDGVILNLNNLKNSYGITDYSKLLIHLFKKQKISFVNLLKGEFSGFIFNKETEELFFFNNKTATKQVYYSQFKDHFVISHTIKSIVSFRESKGIQNTLNIQSTYDLFTFGGMLENTTLVNEVYKLGAGEYITSKHATLILRKYHTFNNIDYSIRNIKEATGKLNESFTTALKLEYEKDITYNFKHIATLSGGLDSRMNVLIANKLGYKPHTFCFSQPNYLDEKIARNIVNDLNLSFNFYSLAKAEHLTYLEKMVHINNGLQLFTGSAHYSAVLEKVNLTEFGLIHSGQIGDGVLGGFVTNNKNIQSKVMFTDFIEKSSFSNKMTVNYANEEVFKLYQRVFNLTNYGSYITEQKQTYLVSPFLDDDFISIALAIHPKLKKNQAIYIDWINQFHKDVANYKWERTGFKPNKKWKYTFSKYTKKIIKEYYLFLNKSEKLNMSPDNYYYNKHKHIQDFYNHYYEEHKGLISHNKPLFNDVNLFFNSNDITKKVMVLTLLESIKYFNLSV